jgi:drug/metabolite transporter (DMT)-like permease
MPDRARYCSLVRHDRRNVTAFLRHLWSHPAWLLWAPPLIWSTHIVLGRVLADVWPSWTLTLVRWIVAFLVLLPFVAHDARRRLPLLRRHWGLILVCGATGMVGYSALAYIALHTTQAANVAFINSMLPLMVPLATLVLAREPIGLRTWLGLVVSSLGVLWILARGEAATLADLSFTAGDMITVAAVASYALYSVLIRRKPPQLNIFVFLLAAVAGAIVAAVPFAAVELAGGARVPRDPLSWLAVAYIGLVISLVAYLIWNRCIEALGATLTGVSYHLLSVFTPLLAYALLGERLAPFHLVGIALILAGVALAALRTRPA